MRAIIVPSLVLGFAVLGMGCDDSTPTSPTSTQVLTNYANTTADGTRLGERDPRGRPVFEGRYEITLTAAPACSELPLPLRSRTFTDLTTIISWDAFNLLLAARPIVERVGQTSFLAIQGTASAPVVRTPTTMTTLVDGSVTFCAALVQPAPAGVLPTCAAPIACRSDRHQLQLVRR